MDIEDWYHVGYLDRRQCDERYSMMDGLDVYIDITERHGIKSSFFCTTETLNATATTLRSLHSAGHDIGSHTETHRRPLLLAPKEFEAELRTSKARLEDALGDAVHGFRAPCFSLDDERLNVVRDAGFVYDSSRVAFRGNPMYGLMRLDGFVQERPFVFRRGDFFEFELSTLRLCGRDVPVSGGGYLRILPWMLAGAMMRRYLDRHDLYILYIHPYELSRKRPPSRVSGLGLLKDCRFRVGLGGVGTKLERVISTLKERGFMFTTFRALRALILDSERQVLAG
jgi:peptidoglycan/xylan/chitin deacetylase (PgdA/CDA1 family)